MLTPTTTFPKLFTTKCNHFATVIGHSDGVYYGCYARDAKAYRANWNAEGAWLRPQRYHVPNQWLARSTAPYALHQAEPRNRAAWDLLTQSQREIARCIVAQCRAKIDALKLLRTHLNWKLTAAAALYEDISSRG